ncbi:MAG: hypothetical protein NT045_06970 [Candidatus Aureabacteria bacterium]|nr:hypothetical protein [Candidatus Auribacterota bacterium]
MKRLLIPVLTSSLMFCVTSCAVKPGGPAAPKASPAKAKAPVTPFEGAWREVRNQGNETSGSKMWEFKGDTITIRDGGKIFAGTFSINESRTPKEMDFQFDGYPLNKAVYELTGDSFTIKVLDTAMERAAILGTQTGYTLIICTKIQ